jgi:hypothetical protein
MKPEEFAANPIQKLNDFSPFESLWVNQQVPVQPFRPVQPVLLALPVLLVHLVHLVHLV